MQPPDQFKNPGHDQEHSTDTREDRDHSIQNCKTDTR
jgi:hypothetical protein